jgi:hypothetical protein
VGEPAQHYRITVDGELWRVVERGDGHYDFTWLSGIDPRYGFTSRALGPQPVMPPEVIEARIRDFMANVNPDTGHLD